MGRQFKWSTALFLVGTEFHQQNLRRNKDKLATHFDPNRPLQPELAELLCLSDNGTAPKVLDVGAGPVSKVGKVFKGGSIELVAVDPVATQYNRILDDIGLKPPVRTQVGYGEKLSSHFQLNSFDLIHARNSIDHCKDPLVVINECIKLLKPGAFLYLNHYLNEGKAANYYGLHQWNFSCTDGKFYISSEQQLRMSVEDHIGLNASIISIATTDERIIVVIQKY
jgi:SAM-dependent methyltransferase